MNALIKKEIRLLLPAWVVAMLLATVPPLLVWTAWKMNVLQLEATLEPCSKLASWGPPVFALGLLLLGISSFGQELNSNSFGILLAQPVERQRVWLIKIVLLAVAFVSIWLIAMFLVAWQFDVWKSILSAERLSYPANNWLPTLRDLESFKFNALESLTASALVAFSGGLWATLLLRQTMHAFWVALLTPLTIVLGIGTVLGFFPISDQTINAVILIVLFCYSIAGFFWAHRLFLGAQDTQWTGGNVLFPWRGKTVEQTASFARPRHRFLALIWKELRLHEVSLFIAAVLLAVHVGALVMHPLVSNRNTKMILELIWSLWLIMPLLIGCTAVAEERKLGVLESQLCLPVSRRLQFAVKFSIALLLGVFLGAVMPTVIERRSFGTHPFPHWIFAVAAAIFFISFYASTLTRSALHAIGQAFVIPMVAWFGLIAFCLVVFRVMILSPNHYEYRGYENICRALLMAVLCGFVFPFVLLRLMFWNFKWLHQAGKMFRLNITAIPITLALLYGLTNAIYYRPWELLTPIESPHGPVRLTAETPAQLGLGFGGMHNFVKITALQPDGKIWQESIDDHWRGEGWFQTETWAALPRSQRMVDSSNWAEIAPGGFYLLGLKQDGSLWAMPQVRTRVRMAQVGSEKDWRKIARNEIGYLLLKNDGTLWLWGTNEAPDLKTDFARNSAKLKLDLAMPPTRISPGTDWTSVVPFAYYRALAQKSDGTYWSYRRVRRPKGGMTNFLVQETNLDSQWSDYAFGWDKSVEIKTNGELWLLEEPPTNWDRGGQWVYSSSSVPPYTKKIELDSEPVWKAVTFTGYDDSLILLRDDGTIWKWNYSKEKRFHPVQLGHYSDWAAVANDNWLGITLAADGSLWSWSEPSDHFWLAPSRRPVYMGNILEGASSSQ